MQRPRSEGLLPSRRAQDAVVAVIGAGAIGSNTVYLLAKLGIGTIHVYDDDVVAEENLEPQFYMPLDMAFDDIEALPKVKACMANVSMFVDDVTIEPHEERWTEDTQPPGLHLDIIVSGVDSLASRFTIADWLVDHPGEWDHYLDLRMGGNIIEMRYVLPGDDLMGYINGELPSIVAEEIPCSFRSVAYNGMLAAVFASRAAAAILHGMPVPRYIKYDLTGWGQEVDFDRPVQHSAKML